MTIRDTTTAATVEPEFNLLGPIYEYDSSNQNQQPQTFAEDNNALVSADYYATASAPVEEEPTSNATALTTGQSFVRREDQLITIPSSNVLLDTSRPTGTTTVKKTKTTTRPTDVTLLADTSGVQRNNNNIVNHERQSKYVRKYGMVINRKNAHLPEPVLRFKQARKHRTAAAAWTGGLVGLVVAGPFGAAVGAGAAYASAKSVGKRRERRMEQTHCSAAAAAAAA